MANRRTFGSIRPTSKGRLQARYVGPDGERYNAPIRFLSKPDANRWLKDVERSISAGTWVSPMAPTPVAPETFVTYANAWLEARKLTPATRAHYRRILDRLLLPVFGDITLDAITPQRVNRWHAGLDERPTQNAHAYALLRTILNSAVSEDIIVSNPCRMKGAATVRRARTITVLTGEQVERLAEEMGERHKTLILVAAYCCLRFGEVSELRRSDFRDGVLYIRRGVTRVNGKVIVGRPKTVAGQRDIPVPAFLRPILAKHLLAFAEPGEDGLIFPAAHGGHLQHATLYKTFGKARAAVDRPDLSFHHLRHTGAVLWAQEGATLKDLMALLGHESPMMAMHYQHLAEGSLERIADRVSKRVTGE